MKPPISDLASQDFDFPHEVDPVKIVPSKHGMWAWAKVQRLFGKGEHDAPSQRPLTPEAAPQRALSQQPFTRPVGVGLPRQATFKRQNSEKRDRLLPVQQCLSERRAVSSTRKASLNLTRGRSSSSPPPTNPARVSAPAVSQRSVLDDRPRQNGDFSRPEELRSTFESPEQLGDEQSRPPRPPSRTSSDDSFDAKPTDAEERAQLDAELDSKWILNLSMHFRDKSDREKFFVTYAQQPNRWRRVTVSCDYRDAEQGSLEMDLKELQYQRDKSLQIYESIRDSLTDIQFYDTVTNLKLQTSDGRLHVHVTEDVNEIIPYPQRRTVSHILENSDSPIPPMEVRECDLEFDSHLSGFVYKVRYQGKDYIKKEIPGPDTVDEFLYEVNALHDLHDTEHVIRLEAIVVDDSRQLVKGLLISYAEKGALVDLLYDQKGQIAWEDRVRWAEQAVRGLSQIHEEGYVQGDFTLSNIVVDGENNAKIIDINRRGCPVGWEPPEIARKIASNQRISMYIGQKSDIYQLGMSLWALAMDDDEPERHDPPLSVEAFPDEVPEWYRNIVRICLAPRPRERLSATDLVEHFPPTPVRDARPTFETRPSLSVRTNSKQYIDPATAVDRDDIQRLRFDSLDDGDTAWTPSSSFNNRSYTYPRSSNYEGDSGSSFMERRRGRSPPSPSFLAARGVSERPRSVREDFSPLDHDGRHLHIVTPLADADYFDYISETNGQPMSREQEEPESPRLISEEASEEFAHEESGQLHNTAFPGPVPCSNNIPFPHDDIELEPPTPAKPTSLTSESTPRNAQSLMESSAATLPPAPQLDIAAADLAGFGGHPDLEEHSPHEQQKSEISAVNDEPPILVMPPRLPFGDSGYDEPGTSGGNHDPEAESDKHHEHSHNEAPLPELAQLLTRPPSRSQTTTMSSPNDTTSTLADQQIREAELPPQP